jgi:hypothetical protein
MNGVRTLLGEEEVCGTSSTLCGSRCGRTTLSPSFPGLVLTVGTKVGSIEYLGKVFNVTPTLLGEGEICGNSSTL